MKKLKTVLGGVLVVAVVAACSETTSGPLEPQFTKGGIKPDLCPAYGDGTGLSGGSLKINTSGDPISVTVNAPAGYLIDLYCVKAGTVAEFINVAPPQASVTITAPSGKAVSHYSLRFVPATTEDGEWCSPGFWRANAQFHGANQWPVSTGTLYNSVISDPSVAGDPTLLDVLLAPNTYGGAAFNAVGTYLSLEKGLDVQFDENGDPIHNCPLSQQGN